jgi:hypothetical protein
MKTIDVNEGGAPTQTNGMLVDVPASELVDSTKFGALPSSLDEIRSSILLAQQNTMLLRTERDRLKDLFDKRLYENEQGLVCHVGKTGSPNEKKNNLFMREKIMNVEFKVADAKVRQRVAERGIDALLRVRAARAGITLEVDASAVGK